MDPSPPPPYSSASPAEFSGGSPSLPEYQSPGHFVIGKTRTNGSLLSVRQITGHLALLNAFGRLRLQIEELSPPEYEDIPAVPKDRERRWSWFVGIAVERFDKWCHSLQECDKDEPLSVLPPLDVIMVWHAYMLNPRWFVEDSIRIPEVALLKGLVPSFAELLNHAQIDELLFSEPSVARRTNWNERTRTPFHYLDAMDIIRKRRVRCPKCRTKTDVPLMNQHGTGYLQQHCRIACANEDCELGTFTKEYLWVRKFAETVASKGTSPRCHLAGTVFSNDQTQTILEEGDKLKTTVHALSRARRDADRAVYPPPGTPNTEYQMDERMCQAIMKELTYRMELGEFGQPRKIRRIVSAYSVDKIYSIDLVGAVLRQGVFVQKMRGLGWTNSQRFSEDTTVLQQCIIRYHAFLDMLATYPKELMVPTLDIDLAWHTHQLLADQYKSDCFAYIGRFIDHDDKIEGTTLSSGFDQTSRLWKERFKVEYSYCGCPRPPMRISQLLSKLVRSSKDEPPTTSELVPAVQSDRTDAFASTHGSDHNAAHFWEPRNANELEGAQVQYQNLRKATEKRAGKSRKDAGKKGDAVLEPHDFAFLIPIPSTVTVLADCVAANGSLINQVGGCSSGDGVCGGGCTAEILCMSHFPQPSNMPNGK